MIVSMPGLKIAPVLYDFIAKKHPQDPGISPDAFWAGLPHHPGILLRKPRTLACRDSAAGEIDGWHRGQQGQAVSDMNAYTAF